MQNLMPAALQVARYFRPQSRWRLWGPLLGLLLVGLLGVALSSHLDSRTAAWLTPGATLDLTPDQPNALVLADDDADGDLDLWVAFSAGRALQRFRNDGRGHFAPAGEWRCGDAAQLRLADLNEDGIPDPVVASYEDSLLTWNPSLGSGRWGPSQVLLRGARSYDLWAGDIDGDRHVDLLVANRHDSAYVLFGDGRGRFPVRRRVEAGPHALGVLAGDVDGDGDPDLLLTSARFVPSEYAVHLYRNEGHRRFTPAGKLAVSESPQRLALADVDADGDPDLLVTAYMTDRVDLCFNDGHGNFGPAQWRPTARQPYALALADFDADGDLDLLTTGALNHQLALLRNLGQGSFGPPILFGVGKTPNALAVGDIDGDGQPDAVTANQADYSVTVLRHSRPPLVWWPLLATGLLGMAYGLYYVYQRRRRREYQRRAQLAADLHDELGGRLAYLTLRAELLQLEAPALQLDEFIAESRSATSTVRDIIWSVNTGPDTLGTLVDRLRDLLAQTQQATAWTTQLALQPPLLNMGLRLRPDVRQHVYLICKEAVTNALRHAPQGQNLHITFTLEPPGLQLHIVNDGPLAAPARAHASGQGRRNMQHRAQQLGGQLQDGPSPGGGWEVRLRVPRVV